jgi:hypothetical protein
MADTILDDIRNKVNSIELSYADGDRIIQFESREEMSVFLQYKQNVEQLYTDLIVNAIK